jgi:hypothetical protein
MLTLVLFTSSKLAQANTNKLYQMSEQTRMTPHSVTMKHWGGLGLGLIICISGALASQMQVSQTPLSHQNSANLPSLAVKEIENKTLEKNSVATKPEWSELTSVQKIALKPLFDNWRFLGDTSKRKWIALSINFQSMTPAEQLKLHARMNEWVALSQQERRRARLNFTQSKQLPPSHRAATWEAYQALSPEEKTRLAQIEKDKKPTSLARLKNGQKIKLAAVPAKIPALTSNKHLASANLMLDRHTLLIRPQAHENSIPKQQ